MRERDKYRKLWGNDAYRLHSPGEWVLPLFASLNESPGSLLDIGCGTGRAGKKLSEMGFDVTLLDFAENAPEVDLPFLHTSLLEVEGSWEYGYCCDVMEHLPPKQVGRALNRIFACCEKVFFSIHFGPDNFGATIGHPLHLTVQPFLWWLEKLRAHGEVVDARDMLGVGVFYVHDQGRLRRAGKRISSKDLQAA